MVINNKKAQVWIETVLYTVIGLALIAIVLGFVLPKLSENKDNLVVEQSIDVMRTLDEKISGVMERGAGNVAIVPELMLKRGELIFNNQRWMDGGVQNSNITFIIRDLSKLYSEPGKTISFGKVKVTSGQGPKTSNVTLTLSYAVDLKYGPSGETTPYTLNPATLPYKLSIANVKDNNGNYLLIKDVSR